MNIKALFGAGLTLVKKYQRPILMVSGMVSTGLTFYFAIKDSEKILASVDNFKNPDISSGEKLKGFAKASGRSLASLGASCICQVFSYKVASDAISTALNAATVYSMLADDKDKKIEELDKAMEETVGEETAEDIRKKASEWRAEKSFSAFDIEKAEITGKGNDLIYLEDFDKWCFSSVNWIDTVVNGCNSRLLDGEPLTGNDFLRDIGLNTIGFCERVGWKEYDDRIEIEKDTDLDDVNRPYVIVRFRRGYEPHSINMRRW